jgi:hypothetical protein
MAKRLGVVDVSTVSASMTANDRRCPTRAARAPGRVGVIVAAAAALLGGRLNAHEQGHSILTLDAAGASTEVSGVLQIPFEDIEPLVTLDVDGDFAVSQSELDNREKLVHAIVIESLNLTRSGAACELRVDELRPIRLESGPHASARLSAQCPNNGALRVSTTLFFGHNAYSVLINVTTSHGAFDAVLTPASPSWSETESATWWSTLLSFVRSGIHHVLIGYDHIAFVLLLLLPSVLQRTSAGWRRVGNVRHTAVYLAKIVTLFTVAHSLTLALATTGLVQLPARPIELTIAASIVVAGIANLTQYSARIGAPLAFVFGLVHGFGFANVLADTSGEGARLVPMLAGFNVGVEIAQLAIVFTALPILLAFCRWPAWSRVVIPGLSVALALCGAIWVGSRW